MLKSLIVDDSRLARVELRHLLKEHKNVTVVGEAQNAEEAIDLLASLKVDLMFLDIQMPGKNGFELLEQLDQCPKVIFTTAYDQYAIKAFEVNALDYLLKPIKPERLMSALEKLDFPETTEQEEQERGAFLTTHDQVFVKDGDRCWFVKLSDVHLFENNGNYTKVHFNSESALVTKSLNYLESRLDHKNFFRTNRRQIINLACIESVEVWVTGLLIKLSSGEEVEVTRRQAKVLKSMMSF